MAPEKNRAAQEAAKREALKKRDQELEEKVFAKGAAMVKASHEMHRRKYDTMKAAEDIVPKGIAEDIAVEKARAAGEAEHKKARDAGEVNEAI